MDNEEIVKQMSWQIEKKFLLIVLLITIIIISIYFIYRAIYRNKVKKSYIKACKEFNISDLYSKKITKKIDIYHEYSEYTNIRIGNPLEEPSNYVPKYCSMDSVRIDTWHHYISQILTELKIDEFDGFLSRYHYTYTCMYTLLKDYKKNNQNRLKIVCNLLHDKHFKYNGFLVENALCLITCLREPFERTKATFSHLKEVGVTAFFF